MKNYYTISRQIICIIAVLLSLIALINEDITVKVVVTIFVFLVTLAATHLTTPISKKLIKLGDGIANKYLRILFYFAILPLTLLIAYCVYGLILFTYNQSSGTINGAAITIFSYIATTIMIIVPYVQMLIVLMFRIIRKDK